MIVSQDKFLSKSKINLQIIGQSCAQTAFGVHMCVCVSVCLYVWGSTAKWLGGHLPGKGSRFDSQLGHFGVVVVVVVVISLSKKLYSCCSSIPSC